MSEDSDESESSDWTDQSTPLLIGAATGVVMVALLSGPSTFLQGIEMIFITRSGSISAAGILMITTLVLSSLAIVVSLTNGDEKLQEMFSLGDSERSATLEEGEDLFDGGNSSSDSDPPEGPDTGPTRPANDPEPTPTPQAEPTSSPSDEPSSPNPDFGEGQPDESLFAPDDPADQSEVSTDSTGDADETEPEINTHGRDSMFSDLDSQEADNINETGDMADSTPETGGGDGKGEDADEDTEEDIEFTFD